MATEDTVGAITYSAEDVDSTALRCCLASADFYENSNACMDEIIELEEYEFDPTAPEGEQCLKITSNQVNKNARGTISRAITVVFG
jgi:hypothetical protein